MLQNLYALESAYQNGWILSTKQVGELLGISPKAVARSESIDRHGFSFTREGVIGTEIGWRIGKSAPQKSTRKSNRKSTNAKQEA
jgi:hypothetical protein